MTQQTEARAPADTGNAREDEQRERLRANYSTDAESLAHALEGKASGAGYMARCPAHDDKNPSLSISDSDSGPLVHCHAGCEQGAVIDALRDRGLWPERQANNGMHHPSLGEPHTVWTYRDAEGRTLGYICRWETAKGKDIRPLVGGRWQHFDKPRPLYGLDRLARNPDAPVIVCEGEKAADAAQRILGDGYVCITWPGGTGSVNTADWTPLQGRTVHIWPDADAPGRKAAQAIAGHVPGASTLEPPQGKAAGWDAADAEHEGITHDDVAAWIQGAGADGESESAWPEPLDLCALAQSDPEPPRMIVNDWLPCGYATMLAGHGGAGKSAIALQLACCIANGTDWCGLPVEQHRVLYLSCEDRERVLHWRLRRTCDHLGIDMAGLAGRLHVLDLVGHDAILSSREPLTGSTLTAAYGELSRTIRDTGAEVVVLDGVADTFGDSENDRAAVKRFVNALVGLIHEDRGAVILVHHVNKPTASAAGTSEGYSGSTGWHNSVRARWYLYPETLRGDDGTQSTGDLLLELQKSNLGSTGPAIRYRWDSDAHTFVGHIESSSTFDQRHREDQERDGIVMAIREVVDAGDYVPAAMQGPRTAYRVLSACQAFPETLKKGAGRKRFARHVEHLRRNREIREAEYRRANRHVVATLEPHPASRGALEGAPNASNEYDAAPNNPTQGAPAPNASYSAGGTRGCAHTHTADDYRRASEGE